MFRPYKPRDYASTKEVVTRALDQAGGIKKAAHLLGRSPTQTTAYSDPAAPDEISFDQMRRLVTATGAPAPAEDLAALAGGVFVPIAAGSESFEDLVARSSTEWGEFISLLMRARADDKLDHLGRRGILKELDSLIRSLVAARSQIITDSTKG